MSDNRLTIAIQKKGRLAEESLDLLKKCGIKLIKSKDQLFCKAENFPLDIYFVRDDDIPEFVASNVCSIGIVGENVLQEKNTDDTKIDIIQSLGFGKCRLSIAVPNNSSYDSLSDLDGKKIATSYKNIVQQFLNEKNVTAELVSMEGAVEVAPRTGIADAICDLVSTGATLALNGLIEKDIVFQSEAVLIRSSSLTQEQQDHLSRLMMRIEGVQKAGRKKYIMLHAPEEKLVDICASIPGSESPSIMPLDGQIGKVAVHAVCDENVFWDTMETLKSKGASSILVLPIEKMLD